MILKLYLLSGKWTCVISLMWTLVWEGLQWSKLCKLYSRFYSSW